MNGVALTSFLRDVEGAEPVGVLVWFLLRLVGCARHVQERVGAARLAVLSGRGPPARRGLSPDLWGGLGLSQARLGAISRPGFTVQLLLLLLSSVPDRSPPGDPRGLRPGGGPPTRRRGRLHGSREGLHARGRGRAYRLRTLRTSVRSHGRDDTEV